MMKKRFLSMALAFVMVLSMLPVQVFAATVSYNSNSWYNATVTVQDESGNRITGATVTVTRSTYDYEVYESGNGQYKFTRNSTSRNQTYTITVAADGYETQTVTMRGNSSNTTVTLVAAEETEQIATFRVFYIADGTIPDSYAGSGEPEDYGPSANDTPLVEINVNITKLIEISQQEDSPVVYNTGSSTSSNNAYEFIPAGNRTDADYLERVSAFWQAVLTCTDEESITAFEETGLFDTYMAYCLKKQSNTSQHSDGVLNVTPPVYVVELYQNEVFFGGGVTDSAENSKFLTAYDILDQYEAHLKQTITWVEDENGKPKVNDDGQFTGTYVDPATNKIHNIAVFQFDDANAQAVEGSEIPYVQRTSTYYLAKYNMSVDEGTTIQYLITYTDGVENEVIFNEHEYAAERGDVVPAYTGVTIREDYIFQGWYLEGDSSGSVYSDADIAAMTVTGDMTFHAVWTPVPHYTGTVKIVLDGTYDAATQTLLTGTLVDPATLLGTQDHLHLYVSADGTEYIQLNHDDVGTFSAELENGTYSIYYAHQDGTDYILASDQVLIMESQDRTRYLFFNSVTYDPNGGTLDGTTDNRVEYHYSGTAVDVYGTVPVREGYLFAGWKSNMGLEFQPGQVLNTAIDHACYLTAQWIRAMDVYVHVAIDHVAVDGAGENNEPEMHNVTFTLDSRTGTSGDYTEIYSKSIVWDGKTAYEGTDYSYVCDFTDDAHLTSYTPLQPNLTGVSAEDSYTVTTHKSGYDIKSITQEHDENGDLRIYVELIYDPHNFDFQFYVGLDEEAKQLPSELWPKAVNVKVTSWGDTPNDEDFGLPADSDKVDWFTITQQRYTYERIELDATGEGFGSYPVWSTDTEGNPYYYRIEVVSYELADGTVVHADDTDAPNVTYVSENKRFFADIHVTDGGDPNTTDEDTLTGAWYENDAQQGTVKAIVSIPAYTVTFVPNGGTLNGTTENTVEEKQIVVPVIENYVPVRDGGYVFDGWYLADENGQMTDQTVASGSALTSDITLIAKWKEPITVSGIVTAGGTYEQVNEDGSVTVQFIYEFDRVKTVTVLLQKRTPSGYYETVDQVHIDLDYTDEGYYFQKTESLLVPVGVGEYAFTGLPNDGTQYRIYVLSPNYSAAYQNEPESATADKLKYNTYEALDYDALLGEVEPNIASVHAHLHFTPPSFDLQFRLDATAIGADFRPDSGELLVTCDGDPAITVPEQWGVISQMIFDGEVKGYDVALTDGVGDGSVLVWKYTYDGATLYDYGLRLASVTTGDTVTEHEENPYYEVSYQAPAHFVVATGEQSQLLIAYLTPKTYSITYEANGGTISGSYTNTHTWSFDTQLSQVIPVRNGYEFAGWYTDEALTQPLSYDTVDASVAQDLVFYAKWNRVNVHLQVVIDHTTDNDGRATNFDKQLHAQLTALDGTDFLPVAGTEKTYGKGYWHTRGDDVTMDTLEVPYIYWDLPSDTDYSVDVALDGYYVVDSLDIENLEGQTETMYTRTTRSEYQSGATTVIEHYVVVCLKFNPNLLDLTFTVEMAEDVDKAAYPVSADVKVTSWYDHPQSGEGFKWDVITQHISSVEEVPIDPETGTGTGTYPVWQWLNAQYAVPYYYRIQVTELKFSDGSVVHMAEQTAGEFYTGSGYTATVYAENGCKLPQNVDAQGNVTTAETALTGAYGAVKTDEAGMAQVAEDGSTVYTQVGTLKAVIDVGRVVFHANNADASCHDGETGADTFRTYYPAAAPLPEGAYSLNEDGTISSFYDIPTFEYYTHNEYIFQGWYTEPDEAGEPIDWSGVYDLSAGEQLHVYAHWLETGTVAQEDDGKTGISDGIYQGYDLIGVQIRTAEKDDQDHYGDVSSGLRFITVLSEELWSQIQQTHSANGTAAEYGFLLCKDSTASNYVDSDDHQMQYRGTNSNGENTMDEYAYLKNVKCSGVVDHFNGTGYRLYTVVVGYRNAEGEALDAALAQKLIARSYLGYYDANGLYRYYYNNYTGTSVYHGCRTSYAEVLDAIG